VCALTKWDTWINIQKVYIVTDHQSIEYWATEHLGTPGGPSSRRGRWHELFSRFTLEVIYVPGATNVVADCLSRWAYPASQGLNDVAIHGSRKDDEEAEKILKEEFEREHEDHENDQDEAESSHGNDAMLAPLTRSARRLLDEQECLGNATPEATTRPKHKERVSEPTTPIPVDLPFDRRVRAPVPEHGVQPFPPQPNQPPHDASSSYNAPSPSFPPQPLPIENPASVSTGPCMDRDWSPHYHECPKWQSQCISTQTEGSDWPPGVTVLAGKMSLDGYLCIPTALTHTHF
jgi:hypothetical protein